MTNLGAFSPAWTVMVFFASRILMMWPEELSVREMHREIIRIFRMIRLL